MIFSENDSEFHFIFDYIFDRIFAEFSGARSPPPRALPSWSGAARLEDRARLDDVLRQELAVEVRANGVVDPALLLLRRRRGLVLEDRIIVPFPLQRLVAKQ